MANQDPWLIGSLSAEQRQRARMVANVALVTIGESPAMTIEMLAHHFVDLMRHAHGRTDNEGFLLSVIERVLKRSAEIAGQDERLATAALRRVTHESNRRSGKA